MHSFKAAVVSTAVCTLALWGCGGSRVGTPDGGTKVILLSLSGDPLDFGAHTVGTSTDHTFTVTNTSSRAASGLALGGSLASPWSVKGGTFPGRGGTCGTTLAAGASCTLVITFAPTTAGSATTTLAVAYGDDLLLLQQFIVVTLTGTAVAPASLSLSDGPTFDYGTHGAGLATDHTFTITNSGGTTATGLNTDGGLAAPFSFKGGSYPGTGGTCGTSLASGAGCTLVVTFAPTTAGSSSANLAMSYNDGASAQTTSVGLTGTATKQALLTISDWSGGGGGNTSPFDYGTDGMPVDHIFYVSNVGVQAATSLSAGALAAPFSFQGGGFPGTGGSCGATLAAGATCTFIVTFTPSGNGTSSASVSLSYFDGAATKTTGRSITGSSTSLAYLSIADCHSCSVNSNPTDYGTLGTPLTRAFYVSNTGAQTATALGDGGTLANGFTFEQGSYPGLNGTCGASLAAGSTCLVTVTFTPSGTGTSSSTLSIKYNNGASTQSATRALTATSTSLALLSVGECPICLQGLNPPPFNYGTTGTPKNQTFYIFNTGAQTATGLADGSALANGFVFKGGSYPGTGGTCGTSLASGSSCQVVVTFTPSGNGTSLSNLTLNYNNGASPQSATRALTATSTSLALLTVSECPGCFFGPNPPPDDFGTLGIAKTQFVYVSNIGAKTATALGDGGTLANGFAFSGGSYPGPVGTCGASLASGSTCVVEILFTPSGSGIRSSALTLSYNDGTSTQAATRALVGTATRRASVTISENSANCGDACGAYVINNGTPISVGTSVSQSFTVSNTGAATATLSDAGGLTGPFSYVGGAYPGTGGNCGSTLAPAATCTVVTQFRPTVPGLFSANVTLNVVDGLGATQQANRTLRGAGQ